MGNSIYKTIYTITKNRTVNRDNIIFLATYTYFTVANLLSSTPRRV